MNLTPAEKRAADQVEQANRSVKRRMRSMWLWIGISFLGVGAFMLVFLVFPRWTHSHKFVSVELIEWQGKPLLVGLWMEYSSSEDDGDCLEGFVVRAIDGPSGKELGEVFMEHEARGMPTGGSMMVTPEGGVWVSCTNAGNMFLEMAPFMGKVQLAADGSLTVVPDPVPKGLLPSASFSHGRISMTNQYNEPVCYEISTGKAIPGACPWEQDKVAQGAFFLAHKEAGSTRSRLWYVRSQNKVPDATISMGFVSGDRPLGGVHLLNDLASNHYKVTEERLAYYQTMGDSGEFKFTAVGDDDYLVNALVSYHDSACAILQMPGETEEEPRYVCYLPDGKKAWEVKLDIGNKLYLSMVPHWLGDQVVLISNGAMAAGIDPGSSEVLWEWRP